jgi:hypothetical protein
MVNKKASKKKTKKKPMMTFVCVPCGREVTVGLGGIMSSSVRWCCDEKMVPKKKTKKSKKRTK